MSETPTPETDKKQNWDRPDNDEWRWIVPSWFARRLERERDEARRERDDSMEELALMQKKLASLIRRWKGRKKEYLNAVTLALEKGDKSASCRYHGQSIGTHWAIEDLELILKRKEEAK